MFLRDDEALLGATGPYSGLLHTACTKPYILVQLRPLGTDARCVGRGARTCGMVAKTHIACRIRESTDVNAPGWRRMHFHGVQTVH